MLVFNSFLLNEVDKCVYSKFESNSRVIICLYVDDMFIFCTSLFVVNETKKFLTSNFDIKDMGEVKVILGIKVIRHASGIFLSQEHFVEKILKKYGHFDCKPVSTPYDSNSQLKKNLGDSVSQHEYS